MMERLTIHGSWAAAAALAAMATIAAMAHPAKAGESQASDSATVSVTVTVLPFAEVMLDQDQVDVHLPDGGGNAEPVYVGGDIRTNVPASVYARITKPDDAPGDWTAEPEQREIDEAGDYRFDELMRIMVYDVPEWSDGLTYSIELDADTVDSFEQIITPEAGTAIITVIPEE